MDVAAFLQLVSSTGACNIEKLIDEVTLQLIGQFKDGQLHSTGFQEKLQILAHAIEAFSKCDKKLIAFDKAMCKLIDELCFPILLRLVRLMIVGGQYSAGGPGVFLTDFMSGVISHSKERECFTAVSWFDQLSR